MDRSFSTSDRVARSFSMVNVPSVMAGTVGDGVSSVSSDSGWNVLNGSLAPLLLLAELLLPISPDLPS